MKYPSDIDYDRDQEPTPIQMMRQEWADEVAALKEQIVEGYKIITKLRDKLKEYASEDECSSCQGYGVYGKHASDQVQAEVDEADAYLDQNESIAKESR